MKRIFLVSLGAVLAIVVIGLAAFDQPNRISNKPESIKAPSVPEKLVFAGEVVPMEDFDVYERFDRELMINTFWHSQTMFNLKKTRRYLPVIEKELKASGVPEDFKYLAIAESGLANVVSPAKASGFWQFMESTGKRYGLEINREVDERYHLEKASKAAAQYLKDSKEKLGSWTLAAAAYNMGENGVERAMNNQGVENYYDLLLNEETARYMFRILAIKEIYSNPGAYGFALDSADYYPAITTREVKVDYGIDNLAQFALDNGATYKELKLLNPWLRKPYLKNLAKKTYVIKLPVVKKAKGNPNKKPQQPAEDAEE